MSLLLKINGQVEPIGKFALPEMSLSSARAEMDIWKFSISLKKDELIELLNSDYQQLVSELKKDDACVGSPQDELSEAAYPELIEVVKNEKLLKLPIGYYLFENLISKFSQTCSNTTYWHDEVSNCKYDAGLVHIYGVCYSKQKT